MDAIGISRKVISGHGHAGRRRYLYGRRARSNWRIRGRLRWSKYGQRENATDEIDHATTFRTAKQPDSRHLFAEGERNPAGVGRLTCAARQTYKGPSARINADAIQH